MVIKLKANTKILLEKEVYMWYVCICLGQHTYSHTHMQYNYIKWIVFDLITYLIKCEKMYYEIFLEENLNF